MRGKTPQLKGTMTPDPAGRKETPNTVNQKKPRRQRDMQQMEENGKNPQHQANEEEISSLPKIELRVTIAKMIQNHGNKMEDR